LASGGGSNLQAILDHLERLGDRRGGEVVLVASDRSDAGALVRATQYNISTAVIATQANPSGTPLGVLLANHRADFVVLAGYLKLVPVDVIATYEGRVINVHPALLPSFGGPGMYGRRVHRAVIDAGVRVSGVTVHFVDTEYDRGRIIAQWPVPVFPGDDASTLAARVLRVEHLVYPRVVDAVASGRTTLANCATSQTSTIIDALPSFTCLPHEDARLVENIELTLGC